MSRRRTNSKRGFARTDRIGSSLREIIADELRRIDDEAVTYVTVTDVEVDSELTRARVFLSSLDLNDDDVASVRAHAGRLRKAIARQGQLRRVPELDFRIDPGLQAGTRVESILRDMHDDRAFQEEE